MLQIEKLCREIPGGFSIGIDGVQVGGNSLLFTKMKGPITQFIDLIYLEDKVHVTDDEAQAACEIILKEIRSEKGKCSSIAVDNAGKGMADSVVLLLRKSLVIYGIIVTRDPAHCIDLGPKDFVLEGEVIKPVVDDTVALQKLVLLDRVNGIKQKLSNQGLVPKKKARIHSDTRMYQVSLTLESAAAQRSLLQILSSREE